MNTILTMIYRNTKLFFKDKGMFFTSLVTPMILLFLYITFLSNVFKDSFLSFMPEDVAIDEKLINALVSGRLFSALLSVSCITVAFCSNMISVQDKVTGARRDLLITPVKKSSLAVSYFVSAFISTFLVCIVAMIACLVYVAVLGWFLTFADLMYIFLDIVLMTLFGTLLSSIVNTFLNTQGQIAAVSTIISAAYGFVCGAYMPIATFGQGLQNVLMFLPGTYGTALFHNHTINSALEKIVEAGVPQQNVDMLKSMFDMNLKFFDHEVSMTAMYLVVCITIVVLMAVYILINVMRKNAVKN